MFGIAIEAGTDPGAGTRAVLDRARAARHAELAAAAELLVTAAEWADLHPVARGGQAAGWGEVDLHGEGLVPLAGEGTPQVAEFAPAELAAHLGISHDAGRQLIGDALELRHRLPRLFDLVLAGTVPAWRARQAAALTTRLTPEMVTRVDKMLASDPQHLTLVRAQRVVEEAVLYYDPDRVVADEQAALAARHVTLVHDSGPATTEVHMCLDTIDALHLDEALADLATRLSRLGDTDPLEVRRAKAVGVLADPQQALDLLETGELTPSTAAGRVSCSCTSSPPTSPTRAGPAGRSSGSVRPPGTCSRPGWVVPTWPGSPSARSSTCTAPTPSTGTTHRPGCARPRSSSTPPACSPAAPATPAAATSTTSRPTVRSRTVGHRARPASARSHPCAAPTTASRPTAAGPTNASPTTTTCGPPPPATSSPSTPDADDPDRPTPAGTPSRRAKACPHPAPGMCGQLICVVSTSSTTEVAASPEPCQWNSVRDRTFPSGSVNQATRSPFGVVHTPWASCSMPS